MSGGGDAKMSMRAVGSGAPAQQVVEGIDQQQPRHEGRHADPERAEQPHRMIDHRALAQGGEDAERQGEDQRQDQGRAGELERRRQPALDVEARLSGRSSSSARNRRARSRPSSGRAAPGWACRGPWYGAVPRSPPARRWGPEAKKVAGSPGSTRISVKVTITTPSSAGIDARSRRPTRRAIPASKGLDPLQIAEVGLPVELVGVAVDRLRHGGVRGWAATA